MTGKGLAPARVVLLDVGGAAEYLGMNVSDLRRLIEERQVPFLKVGSRFRFDPRDLDAVMNGEVESTLDRLEVAVDRLQEAIDALTAAESEQ